MRRVVVFALFVAMLVGSGFVTAAAEAKEVDWIGTKASDVEVFMAVGASTRQLDRVERAIRSADAVQRYAFVDHHLAYREFKRIFRKKPKLVRSIRPSDLPESFRVETRSKAAAEKLARRARRMPGVESAEPKHGPLTEAELVTMVRDCELRAGSTLEIFMDVGASEAQVDATLQLVEAQPGLTVIRVLSQEDSYAEFVKIFASQPDPVQKASAADLPMSIRVHGDAYPSQEVFDVLESEPGVDSVETPSHICVEILDLAARGLTPEQVAELMVEQT